MASPERIKTAWLGEIRAHWGSGPHLSCLGGMDHLITEILVAGSDHHAFLFEFGRRCAVEEFSLADANAWITLLIERAGRRTRRVLSHRDAAIAVARGWADGTGERERRASTNVSSMQLLELRLNQQYDRCAALGVRLNDAHALAVFEADVGNLGTYARAALIETVANEARRRFHHGETISSTPTGRLVVLTERSAGLPATVQSMLSTINASPTTAGSAVRGWIEPLANERLHLGSHMASLAS